MEIFFWQFPPTFQHITERLSCFDTSATHHNTSGCESYVISHKIRMRYAVAINKYQILAVRHSDCIVESFILSPSLILMPGVQYLDFRNPEIVAVRVCRRFTEEEAEKYRESCLARSEDGAVLISPFISSKEKEIMKSAMDAGGKLIIIRKEGIPPLFKPPGKFFDYCAEGKLLYLAPWEYDTRNSPITRQECVEMNTMAEIIATSNITCRLKIQ